MTATLAAFEKGHQFAPVPLDLSDEWISTYVDAVEDEAIGALAPAVPPMALATLGVSTLLDSAGLPDGAVHVAQELQFHRAAMIGERLSASAKVLSRGERAGWVLMGIELAVSDESSGSVMSGRATITFPIGGAD